MKWDKKPTSVFQPHLSTFLLDLTVVWRCLSVFYGFSNYTFKLTLNGPQQLWKCSTATNKIQFILHLWNQLPTVTLPEKRSLLTALRKFYFLKRTLQNMFLEKTSVVYVSKTFIMCQRHINRLTEIHPGATAVDCCSSANGHQMSLQENSDCIEMNENYP